MWIFEFRICVFEKVVGKREECMAGGSILIEICVIGIDMVAYVSSSVEHVSVIGSYEPVVVRRQLFVG
jgi:hypothetical protein